MPRRLTFPTLRSSQLVELQRVLRARRTPASLRQRSRLIWLLAGGTSLADASEFVELHYTNAHGWMKRFLEFGIAGLADRPKSGRPRRYGDEVTTEVIKAATARPKDLGLKFTTWSLPKLQEHLRQRLGVEGITRSTIRRRLRQQGFRFRDGQTWCESRDPDFEVKKTRS